MQAVEMSDSIFTGLQLSAPVRKNEESDSPYLKRASGRRVTVSKLY